MFEPKRAGAQRLVAAPPGGRWCSEPLRARGAASCGFPGAARRSPPWPPRGPPRGGCVFSPGSAPDPWKGWSPGRGTGKNASGERARRGRGWSPGGTGPARTRVRSVFWEQEGRLHRGAELENSGCGERFRWRERCSASSRLPQPRPTPSPAPCGPLCETNCVSGPRVCRTELARACRRSPCPHPSRSPEKEPAPSEPRIRRGPVSWVGAGWGGPVLLLGGQTQTRGVRWSERMRDFARGRLLRTSRPPRAARKASESPVIKLVGIPSTVP